MTSILNIGRTALMAAQVGIDTTGHNIANASTDGYSRQIVVQAALAGQNIGGCFVGRGTEVQAVQRIYSDYKTAQVRTTQSSYSELNTYYAQIQQIDNILADSTVGVSPSLQNFFTSIQDLAAAPGITSTRQSVLSAASTLVSTFHNVNQQLDEISEGVNSGITSSITSINAYAKEIANLNEAIAKATASTQGQIPNDLYDQRDQMLAELSKEVKVSVVKEGNSYDVYIGNGQPLVVVGTSYSLAAVASDTDPTRMEVAYQNQNGTKSIMSANAISGGNLGGLLEFRSETLDVVQNTLGRMATVLASTFNAQHSLGQDLNGNMARSFSGIAATANNTTAAALSVAITDADLLTTSGYQLAYDDTASTYTLTRLSDNTVLSNTDLAAAKTAALTQGFSLSETSAMLDGDAFTIMPTLGSDFFNVASPLVTASTLNDASSTGMISATIGDATLLTASDYKLTYDGTAGTYALTRLSDNTVLSNTDLAAAKTAAKTQGFDFTASGTFADGDVFLIRPTANGAAELSVAITSASEIAAGSPVIAAKGSSNTGSGVISKATVNNPMTVSESTLRETVTISFNANGTYNVTNATGTLLVPNQTYTEGADISYNGWTIQLTGTPKSGDTFTVSSNASGVGDNSNATLLGNLQTSKLVEGDATYQTAYSQMVNFVGNKTSELASTSAAAETLYNNSYEAQQSESGVNLEEEAVSLLVYQQAYQAAAKVMQIADELFQTLLAIKS